MASRPHRRHSGIRRRTRRLAYPHRGRGGRSHHRRTGQRTGAAPALVGHPSRRGLDPQLSRSAAHSGRSACGECHVPDPAGCGGHLASCDRLPAASPRCRCPAVGGQQTTTTNGPLSSTAIDRSDSVRRERSRRVAGRHWRAGCVPLGRSGTVGPSRDGAGRRGSRRAVQRHHRRAVPRNPGRPLQQWCAARADPQVPGLSG